MEIKDIVEQEKHKRSLVKIKQREEKLTRKHFLKDCYKFWKEYKKVESPYFWWLDLFNLDFTIHPNKYFICCVLLEIPETFITGSWFRKKWKIKFENLTCLGVKRNGDPNSKYVFVKC